MKFLLFVCLFLFLFTAASENISAQQKHQKLTIILLRHAEKDLEEDEITPDAKLSAKGEIRAQKLTEIIEKYKPDAIFSSQFKRTRSTIMPFARKNRMMIQIYDHKNLQEIAALATAGNFKRIVIVGHNSTTPALVNLLIGQDKYKALDEAEYDKIFIVRIKKKKRSPDKIREEKVITY